MATRVDKPGIDGCVSKINSAIEQLIDAAKNVDNAMNELPNYWEGTAHNTAQATYIDNYKGLLTDTVPTSVSEFKEYINQCTSTIVDVDTQLGSR